MQFLFPGRGPIFPGISQSGEQTFYFGPESPFNKSSAAAKSNVSAPHPRSSEENCRESDKDDGQINPHTQPIDNHGCHAPFLLIDVSFLFLEDVFCQDVHIGLPLAFVLAAECF